jgi:hypothetical protein
MSVREREEQSCFKMEIRNRIQIFFVQKSQFAFVCAAEAGGSPSMETIFEEVSLNLWSKPPEKLTCNIQKLKQIYFSNAVSAAGRVRGADVRVLAGRQ